MFAITDTQLKHLYTLKLIHIKKKMNAQKDFHIFACMFVIKICVTGLVFKDKNAQSP